MGPYLIKAGRVFDGIAERVLEQAYLIVEGDRLSAVGRQAELQGSSAERFAQIFDLGPEVTVLPGLINMHTHMTFSAGASVFDDDQRDSHTTKLLRAVEHLKEALATGVTTIRDCGALNSIAFPVRQAVEQGLLLGPRVIAAGAGITTTGGHCWYCGVEADSVEDVRRAVRAQVKAGADFIKVFATGGGTTPGTNSLAAQYSEQEMCAVTAEARRLDKRVAAHAHGTPGIRTSIAARVTTIEHCSFLQPQGNLYEPELGRRIADEGIYVCPTIFRGRGKLFHEDDVTPEAQQHRAQRQARFHLVRQLIDAGVRLISGSDAGVAHNSFSDYPGDLVLTVEGPDLSPAYVLKSTTSVAAEALGREDIGALVPGRVADILAVRGNPLENIRALHAPVMVMVRGRVVRHGDIIV